MWLRSGHTAPPAVSSLVGSNLIAERARVRFSNKDRAQCLTRVSPRADVSAVHRHQVQSSTPPGTSTHTTNHYPILPSITQLQPGLDCTAYGFRRPVVLPPSPRPVATGEVPTLVYSFLFLCTPTRTRNTPRTSPAALGILLYLVNIKRGVNYKLITGTPARPSFP